MKITITLFAAMLLAACATGGGDATPARLFTAHNIWFESPQKVYSTNYQKGNILPAGSEVKDVNHYRDWGLEFVDVKSGKRFSFSFVGKHHPGLTEKQWIDRLITASDLPALTMGLTASEIEAIKAGEARVGMSKRAVLLSLGYPPEIATASTDLDVWRFWRNRFASYAVRFTDGKVSNSGR